ncbi:MAG: hypothetical protein ACTSXA_14055 [Candidatus Heimdallarchaeota archaeon]
MSGRKIRGVMHPFQFLIDEDTKDMLDDLMTEYGDEEDLMKAAIEFLHRKHYGSPIEEKSVPRLSPKSDLASEKLDALVEMFGKVLEQPNHIVQAPATNTASIDTEKQLQLTKEANQIVIDKIEELGIKFSKQVAEESQTNGVKHVTKEMSNEEIIQLLKRMEQMESKITRVISEKSFAAARSSGPSRTGPLRDLGDAPKIHAVEGSNQPMDDVERPLLDDVLDTVIVSVEDDE